MRYRAKIIPLYEGHRQEEKATWEYTNAASISQAGRFLRVRFPYPKFVVEEPMEDPKAIEAFRPIKRTEEELLELNEIGKRIRESREEGNSLKTECAVAALDFYTTWHELDKVKDRLDVAKAFGVDLRYINETLDSVDQAVTRYGQRDLFTMDEASDLKVRLEEIKRSLPAPKGEYIRPGEAYSGEVEQGVYAEHLAQADHLIEKLIIDMVMAMFESVARCECKEV